MSIELVRKILKVPVTFTNAQNRPRVVLSPTWGDSAIIFGHRQPAFGQCGVVGGAMDLGISKPAAAVDFRPHSSFAKPSEVRDPNNEVAVAFGEGSHHIERFDLILECALEPLAMQDVTCLAHSHDGNFLAAGAIDGFVKVWRLGSRGAKLVFHQRVCDQRLTNVALSANSDVMFFTTSRGEFQQVVVQDGCETVECSNPRLGIPSQFNCWTVACHPRNNAIAAFGGEGSSVYIVNYGTGKSSELKLVGTWAKEVRFLPNLRQVSVLGHYGVEVFDYQTGKHANVLRVEEGAALTAQQYGDTLYVAFATPV